MGKKATERHYLQGCELRAVDGDARRLEGHVALFDSPSIDLGYIETIKRGAFRKTLNENANIKALWNHDSRLVLGNSAPSAGTLRLREDERGLLASIDLPNTSYADDVYELVKRGDVPGSSFAFNPIVDKWIEAKDGQPARRELIEVELREISVGVTFPAYPSATEVVARSLDSLRALGMNVDDLAAIYERSQEPEYQIDAADEAVIARSLDALRQFVSSRRKEPETEPLHSSAPEKRRSFRSELDTFLSRGQQNERHTQNALRQPQ